MRLDIPARKHIAQARRILHPDAHGIILEVALGQSHEQLHHVMNHFQDCFHVLNLLKLNHYYWPIFENKLEI